MKDGVTKNLLESILTGLTCVGLLVLVMPAIFGPEGTPPHKQLVLSFVATTVMLFLYNSFVRPRK